LDGNDADNTPKEAAMAINLQIGSVVVNFGIRAEVVAFLSDGTPIVQGLDRGDRWAVDPTKCEIVRGYEAVMPHPTALVQMAS
jgi:hypothetical protein